MSLVDYFTLPICSGPFEFKLGISFKRLLFKKSEKFYSTTCDEHKAVDETVIYEIQSN